MTSGATGQGPATEGDCPTCNNTGAVWSADYDGSGYDQACPDCDRPYPGSDEATVLCAGCATDDGHCDGEVPDCDCTCGLPPDWAGEDEPEHGECRDVGGCSPECPWNAYPVETDDEYIASVAHLLPLDALVDEVIVVDLGDDPERPRTSANTCEQAPEDERLANTSDWAAVDHEQEPAEALPSLPEDQDDPGPLYTWQTGEFAAVVTEDGAS